MLVFEENGKPEYPKKKSSRSIVENQQTQPTYDAESGNQTWDTLVGRECSHHCVIHAPTGCSKQKHKWRGPKLMSALFTKSVTFVKIEFPFDPFIPKEAPINE